MTDQNLSLLLKILKMDHDFLAISTNELLTMFLGDFLAALKAKSRELELCETLLGVLAHKGFSDFSLCQAPDP